MKRRPHKLEVSTFPFLAVLLCAMGSLILVLLAMDRMARQAAVARVAETAQKRDQERARSVEGIKAENDRRRQQALAAWEAARLALHAQLQAKKEEQNKQAEAVDKQVDDATARARDEVLLLARLRQELEAEMARLDGTKQALDRKPPPPKSTRPPDRNAGARDGMQQMSIELIRLEQTLKDLQEARSRDGRTFSVIPYKGKHGENRRPIYVECTCTGVIFHPERLALSPDTERNAVRTETERRIAQERQRRIALKMDTTVPPFLMLLIRPDGIFNYYAYQSAVNGLGIQFGYEMVDPDWLLEFPEDNEAIQQSWMVKNNNPVAPAAPGSGLSGVRPTPVSRGNSWDPPRQVGAGPAGVVGARGNGSGWGGPPGTGPGGGTGPRMVRGVFPGNGGGSGVPGHPDGLALLASAGNAQGRGPGTGMPRGTRSGWGNGDLLGGPGSSEGTVSFGWPGTGRGTGPANADGNGLGGTGQGNGQGGAGLGVGLGGKGQGNSVIDIGQGSGPGGTGQGNGRGGNGQGHGQGNAVGGTGQGNGVGGNGVVGNGQGNGPGGNGLPGIGQGSGLWGTGPGNGPGGNGQGVGLEGTGQGNGQGNAVGGTGQGNGVGGNGQGNGAGSTGQGNGVGGGQGNGSGGTGQGGTDSGTSPDAPRFPGAGQVASGGGMPVFPGSKPGAAAPSSQGPAQVTWPGGMPGPTNGASGGRPLQWDDGASRARASKWPSCRMGSRPRNRSPVKQE